MVNYVRSPPLSGGGDTMKARSRSRSAQGISLWRRFILLVVVINAHVIGIQCLEESPSPQPRKADEVERQMMNVPKPGDDGVGRVAPFDTDIRDDCRSLLEYCQSSIIHTIYLECPALCTKYLQQEGTKGTVSEGTEEALWEGTFRTLSGKRINADRFEGSVMVIALLPLLPGMAKYYYDMMEALHQKFHPKVEIIIIPIDVGEGIHIRPRPEYKVVVLEEESNLLSHPWIKHLYAIKPRSGAASRDHNDEIVQVDLPMDRLTIYLVSADGHFMERMTVPTMATLQKRIGLYLRTIDYIDL